MFEKSILFSSLGFAALFVPSTLDNTTEPLAEESSASALQDSRPAESKPAAQEDKKQRELPTADPAKDAAVGQIQRFIDEQIGAGKINKKNLRWKTSLPLPPKVTDFDAKKDYFWNIRTNKGDIQIKLMPDIAPMHVSSTMFLVRLGFYDGLTFHRVIQGFMAQGGDPLGTGGGGPGYSYDGEFSKKARHNKAGMLSMAHRGPGTDGSQFFLTFKATPHLDDKHTVFGEIVGGLDTLRALEAAGSGRGPTTEPLHMVSSTISTKAKPQEGEKKTEGKAEAK